MNTFVLIISSLVWSSAGGMSSVTESIPGFTTMEKCMTAGSMHTQKMLERKLVDRLIFTCNAQ